MRCAYCSSEACFDLYSARPRCHRHWRYQCGLCLTVHHFAGLIHCPEEDDLFCSHCALGDLCPYCGEPHAARDGLDCARRLVPDPPGLVRRFQPGDGFFPALESPEYADVEAQWSGNAEAWTQSLGNFGDAARRVSDPSLLDLMGPLTGKDVLDAGAGEGYLSRLMFRQGPGRLVSLELSHKLHERARTAQPDGIEYIQGSVCSMGMLASGSFDCVVANNVMMYCSDASAAVREFHRVLRPAGAAVVSFSHPCFAGPVSAAVIEPPDSPLAEDSVCRVVGGYFDRSPRGFFQPGYHSKITFFPRTLTDYFQIFRGAGFTVTHLVEPEPPAAAAVAPRFSSLPLSILFRLSKERSQEGLTSG
ncbi:class I SAM-dependent methyltransferase [bacterium CPR1]|nr:class I SAM-dependent methyltransferase [bacterium CPR1]